VGNNGGVITTHFLVNTFTAYKTDTLTHLISLVSALCFCAPEDDDEDDVEDLSSFLSFSRSREEDFDDSLSFKDSRGLRF
jgi:hypothetical protein